MKCLWQGFDPGFSEVGARNLSQVPSWGPRWKLDSMTWPKLMKFVHKPRFEQEKPSMLCIAVETPPPTAIHPAERHTVGFAHGSGQYLHGKRNLDRKADPRAK